MVMFFLVLIRLCRNTNVATFKFPFFSRNFIFMKFFSSYYFVEIVDVTLISFLNYSKVNFDSFMRNSLRKKESSKTSRL